MAGFAGVAAGAGAAGRGAPGGAPGAVVATGFAGLGAMAAGAPPAGALGFGTAAAGVPAAGAFAAGVAAAGFAAAAALGAGRKNAGVGKIPDFASSISIIRKKIPAIIAQTSASMIPSMLLVSSPLVMSQTIPQRASNMKTPQIALISIAVLLRRFGGHRPTLSNIIQAKRIGICATVACINHFARTFARCRFAHSATCSRIMPSTNAPKK